MFATKAAAQGPQPAVPNAIQQDTALYGFFAQLEQADSTVVNVLHLGDSHIQAGFLPVATGEALQKEFGNAGRGWVFPYNLAGTNGPDDYRWHSTVRWKASRVIDRHKEAELGPGAIVITTTSASPAVSFSVRQTKGPGDEVHTAQLFYDAGNADCSVVVPGAQVMVTPGPFGGSATLGRATLEFPGTVQSFQARWDDRSSDPFRFYGAILRNGQSGILYHAIGINGAQYQHYMESANTLAAQLEVLQPQLIIISLGTNEAYAGLSAAAFTAQMDSVVSMIQAQRPEAAILLTTPPECMRTVRRPYRKKVNGRYRTYYRTRHYTNPAIAMVTREMVSYCRRKGLACWNFNALNKARADSFRSGWAPDHIHFNARGYQLQGKLLYEALHEAYQQYLEQKHGKDN
ncbi:GDSL-type esterase/lipase family protein [Chitinophaga japonensis]|uniref:GDSL-type esterase/lipase family protein n=1 Tax=Chitinophaga japonensis TaxID=104662 RepID=UPI0013152F91|nr:GDSL-type esterase/lipase family protein [Chitinophaga japonensis]